MASSNVCWGIEIGAGAIKALKLARDGEGARVEDFALIPHPRVLSTPDIDPKDAIRVALGTLATQHDLSKAQIAISVPGHSAFVRFAKLPPVEKKKVPEIVKFEAVQQIPFPIQEVEWDYQTFGGDEESPEIEVGIFAITRERVMDRLAVCRDVGLEPALLNISPVSVFNAIAFDLALQHDSPGTVMLDIGTTATDLIVYEHGRVWIRTFPMGGHNFTDALVSAFKLNYSKAEKLKREADRHEHKRNIFQAMRPVFSDLAQDVQRSIQYYQQLRPKADLKRMIVMGSTCRLMGLRKFLSQQLQMEVTRLDRLSRLSVEGARQSDFQAMSVNMATAYGLAVQGLGMGTINANLIPLSVTRENVWRKKTPWFAAAAVLALAAGAVSFFRPITDRQKVEEARQSADAQTVAQVKREGQSLISAWHEVEGKAALGAKAQNIRGLVSSRDLMSLVVQDLGAMLAAADPQPELLAGGSAAASVPPGERRIFDVKQFNVDYVTPSGGEAKAVAAAAASAESGGDPRGAPRTRGRRAGGGGARGAGAAALGGGETGGGGQQFRDEPEDEGFGAPAGDGLGSLKATLVVESTHAGRQAFVDAHLLEWLRENADRAGWPYAIEPPTVDNIVVEEVAGGTAVDAAPAPGASAERGGGERSATMGGARTGSRAAATSTPTGIDALAPLPAPPQLIPPGTAVYRYTIEWTMPLRKPGAATQAADEMGGDA